jgi:hypothetical protein
MSELWHRLLFMFRRRQFDRDLEEETKGLSCITG